MTSLIAGPLANARGSDRSPDREGGVVPDTRRNHTVDALHHEFNIRKA
jgi:hypothetical protein